MKASQRQIPRVGDAAMLLRDDVIDLMRKKRIITMNAAVFTKSERALQNDAADCSWDVSFAQAAVASQCRCASAFTRVTKLSIASYSSSSAASAAVRFPERLRASKSRARSMRSEFGR